MSYTQQAEIATGNADQAAAWDGAEGDYWAAHADAFDASIGRYQPVFDRAADIAATDHVLDIGCGTGETTRHAARQAPAGGALGVDLSAAMLAVARHRAEQEGVGNARFVQADAQLYPFEPDRFDLAISRTGATFFDDPVAAFRNVRHALRRGGRLLLLTWQDVARNPWLTTVATALAAGRPARIPPPHAPSPFAFADPDRIRSVLVAAGYDAISCEDHRQFMSWGADADGAFRLAAGLASWMLDGLDARERQAALGALRAAMRAHETPEGVLFDSAMWLVTARRAA